MQKLCWNCWTNERRYPFRFDAFMFGILFIAVEKCCFHIISFECYLKFNSFKPLWLKFYQIYSSISTFLFQELALNSKICKIFKILIFSSIMWWPWNSCKVHQNLLIEYWNLLILSWCFRFTVICIFFVSLNVLETEKYKEYLVSFDRCQCKNKFK